jgi:hypothetical protein
MQFRLRTIFLLFVVLWASLNVFGACCGCMIFVALAGWAICYNHRPTWRPSANQIFFLVVFLVFAVLLAYVIAFPADGSARESPPRCYNNMKQIGCALHNYQQANHHSFPPAYITDKNGRPMHSWRVLILPYLPDGEAIYKQYDFNEPWDGPNNRKLLAMRPNVFACPHHSTATTCTNYAAVVGDKAAWPGEKPQPCGMFPMSETVMLVEVADDRIAWTEPRDMELADAKKTDSASPTVAPCYRHEQYSDEGRLYYYHFPSTNVLLADGSTGLWPMNLVADPKYTDLFSVGGYNNMPIASWGECQLHICWFNCIRLALNILVWLISTGLLILIALRSKKSRLP